MATQEAEIVGTCIMCPRRGSKFCAGCKDAQYCSKAARLEEPQDPLQDLPHFSPKPSPSPRAILSRGSNVPRFEWVPLYSAQRGEDFLASQYLGINSKIQHSISHNHIQARPIFENQNESLHYFTKDQLRSDSYADPANLGLRSFTRGGACFDGFRGPVVVMRVVKADSFPLKHLDMDMRDVRNTADYFTYYGRVFKDNGNHLHSLRVLGSLIGWDGSTLEGQTRYSERLMAGYGTVFHGFGSSIANLLGLPLLAFPIAEDSSQVRRNTDAVLLYRDLNSTRILPSVDPLIYLQSVSDRERIALWTRKAAGVTGFGSSLDIFEGSTTGSVEVMRVDGKPLPKEHIEALCSYIRDKIEPQLVATVEGLTPDTVVSCPRRDAILESVTRVSFLEYFNTLKDDKIVQGQLSWVDLPSPYDIKQSDVQARINGMELAQRDTTDEEYVKKESLPFARDAKTFKLIREMKDLGICIVPEASKGGY